MIVAFVLIFLAVGGTVLYLRFRKQTQSNSLVKRELGRFRSSNKTNSIRASELTEVIKKLDVVALKSGKVHFECYDNERILVAHLLDLVVFSRCNLMEYMDITRLLDHTVRRAGL